MKMISADIGDKKQQLFLINLDRCIILITADEYPSTANERAVTFERLSKQIAKKRIYFITFW